MAKAHKALSIVFVCVLLTSLTTSTFGLFGGGGSLLDPLGLFSGLDGSRQDQTRQSYSSKQQYTS